MITSFRVITPRLKILDSSKTDSAAVGEISRETLRNPSGRRTPSALDLVFILYATRLT